jgi:hypothetical protein
MSLRKNAIRRVLVAACILTIYVLPIYAQTANFEQAILNDPALKENTEGLVQA